MKEINTRKVQIKDKFRCDFIEYIPENELDETKQLDLTDEERYAIGVTKCFDLDNNCVVDYDNSKDILKQEKLERISELKSLLSATDYKAIKYAEGLLSEEEYAPIKSQRQAYRDEINELERAIYKLEFELDG